MSDSDSMAAQRANRPRTGIAALAGVVTGAAAGFIGVGGGEFRIPVLVEWVRLPLAAAGAVNLLVGLFTVALSVVRRGGLRAQTSDDLALVAMMGAASLVGASAGAYVRDKLPRRPLKLVVCIYLGIVGVWMLYETAIHREHVLFEPVGTVRLILAAGVALPIAIISGVLGVAGGEMRIPALLYLFGMPITLAGTLSLIVSLPTLIAGVLTDRRLGALPNAVLAIGLVMGLASAVGVLFGTALIPYANRETIKGVLGAILVIAAAHMAWSEISN